MPYRHDSCPLVENHDIASTGKHHVCFRTKMTRIKPATLYHRSRSKHTRFVQIYEKTLRNACIIKEWGRDATVVIIPDTDSSCFVGDAYCRHILSRMQRANMNCSSMISVYLSAPHSASIALYHLDSGRGVKVILNSLLIYIQDIQKLGQLTERCPQGRTCHGSNG